jgi:type VI secretion system protein VasJ
VVKDSSDSVGRPYPLILMGMGPMANWDAHWDEIPLACELSWAQLESISTRPYRDFKQMESDLRTLKPPTADWGGFGTEGEPESSTYGEETRRPELEGILTQRMNSDVLILPLSGDRYGDSTRDVRTLHVLLKRHSPAIPKAVFMGGRPTETMLAVFKRPLLPEDFGRLWFVKPIP